MVKGKGATAATMSPLQRWAFLALCIILFSWILLRSHNDVQVLKIRYGVMLDAGSTGSRVHVYQFAYSDDGPQILSEIFEQLKPGLSSFANDPKEAALSLKPLLDIAKEAIPSDEHKCTPLVLKATAGLRLLPGTQAADILSEVRAYLKKSGFFLPDKGVEIMDGTEEGVFAWITVNFLLGRLGAREKKPTVGIMDLGGGSTQIVFEPTKASMMEAAPASNLYVLQFGAFTYRLYQHSYLGFGLMEGRKKVKLAAAEKKMTACLPSGFVDEASDLHGISEGECFGETDKIFQESKGSCTFSTCSFNGVFQPPFAAFPKEMYAFSYFYDRTESMAAPFPPAVIVDSYLKEADIYCGKSVEDEKVSSVLKENSHLCLDLSFIHSLLTTGYGIPSTTSLTLSKKIKGYETGWCMGAMMKVLDDYSSICPA